MSEDTASVSMEVEHCRGLSMIFLDFEKPAIERLTVGCWDVEVLVVADVEALRPNQCRAGIRRGTADVKDLVLEEVDETHQNASHGSEGPQYVSKHLFLHAAQKISER